MYTVIIFIPKKILCMKCQTLLFVQHMKKKMKILSVEFSKRMEKFNHMILVLSLFSCEFYTFKGGEYTQHTFE